MSSQIDISSYYSPEEAAQLFIHHTILAISFFEILPEHTQGVAQLLTALEAKGEATTLVGKTCAQLFDQLTESYDELDENFVPEELS